MKVGVLSDTHLRQVDEGFREMVERYFSECDHVIHLGDFTSLAVYEFLKEFFKGEIHAVSGNMDPAEIRRVLPERDVIELGGVRIGLIHGWGAPYDLEERVEKVFAKEDLQCVLYGHTHNGSIRKRGGRLLFNPGSPTDRFHAKKNTVGVLKIEGGSVEAELVEVFGSKDWF